jgi:hypothetical protein
MRPPASGSARCAAPGGTTITGQGAVRTVSSATLPSSVVRPAPYPCVPTTTNAASSSSAVATRHSVARPAATRSSTSAVAVSDATSASIRSAAPWAATGDAGIDAMTGASETACTNTARSARRSASAPVSRAAATPCVESSMPQMIVERM